MLTVGRFVIDFQQVIAVEQKSNFLSRLFERLNLPDWFQPGIVVHLSTGRVLKLSREESKIFFPTLQNHELAMEVMGMVAAGTKRI